MALSYEFSIGSVRARENSMFSEADAEQMLALKSIDELVRFLKDKGYGEGDTVDEIIESNTRKMWKYIRSIAPDFDIFEPFLIQNDLHNFKTVLKGTMSDRDYEQLMMEPCTIKKADMVKAVENRRFDVFPEWLRKPADKAYQRLAETKDARLSDAGIDRAVLERLLFLGKKSGSVFLSEYFRTLVFYANVKTALRGAKAGVERYFYDKALCEVEGFDKQAVTKEAVTSEEALVKYLEKHIGKGHGTGLRSIDPVTEAELEENAVLEMDTAQIGGVDRTTRTTSAKLGAGAKLYIRERILTEKEQTAKTEFYVEMNGKDSGVDLISRSVARDDSRQGYHSVIVGNAPCTGHSECDAIISENGKVDAAPELHAHDTDAALIHEAAIGKIAGEQILKLRTLGMTEEEAEATIIDGFLS